MPVDDPLIEDLGGHRFLVTVDDGEDVVEIQVYADPGVVEQVAPADEGQVVHAATAFLLERQRADDLPGQVALDEVAAVYAGFIDDIRQRITARS
jgi:hypothetical protein